MKSRRTVKASFVAERNCRFGRNETAGEHAPKTRLCSLFPHSEEFRQLFALIQFVPRTLAIQDIPPSKTPPRPRPGVPPSLGKKSCPL